MGSVWSLLHNGHQAVSSLDYSFYVDLTALVTSTSNIFNFLQWTECKGVPGCTEGYF